MSSNEFEAISDRLPPQNIEAEEAILGGILIDPEAIGRVLDLLQPEMFYVAAHQEIYRACVTLHNQSRPTDMMSISTWLSDRDVLEKIGGQSKIVQLCDRTVSAVNVDYYAQLVADKHTRRKLAEAGRETVSISYDTNLELPQALDLAEQKIFAVTQSRTQQGLTLAADVLTNTFSELEARFNSLGSAGTNLPGLATGFYDLDAMTQGFQRSDLIIIAGRPSMGKCLSADSEIVVADGSVTTIANIYQKRQAQLLTLGHNWRLSMTAPSAFIDDGIKPVFRVTTRLGKVIETTITHPYLTMRGWQALAALRAGDKIAVPRCLEIFGTEKLRECEVKLLGYFIGDGCLTKTTPEFTNVNPQIQTDFTQAACEFAELKVRIEDSQGTCATSFYVTALQRGTENQLTVWLRELGLWGKNSHTKFVPDVLFRLERSQVALFLNRLFATDGWASVLTSGQVQLGYASVSEKLARQVQHLLLRFGIIARLKERAVKYKGDRRRAWQLDITDALSIKTFIDQIGIFGKENNLAKVQAALAFKKYQTNCDLIPVEIWEQIAQAKGEKPWADVAKAAGIQGFSNIHVGKRAPKRERLFALATALENVELQNLATSDIYWDEIVAIESVGLKQVYDLTIPETHNFVANDICVHNTAFGLAVANKMAELHRLPIAIFSLEMSKEQLVYRLLANSSRIDSSRLRSGQISENEWSKIGNAIANLSDIPIFIDDTANPSINELRSKSRRLQAEKGGALGLILIDYLQLMEGSGSDNRVQELSRITRSLKGLARELAVPVIALSQLSRGVEARTNKRPMLSDLRESGCLSGDALVTLAHAGTQVPIRDLVGQSGFTVWALNENTMQLEPATVTNAFSTGVKHVLKMTTQLGRTVQATGNHKFLTIHGWRRLDELQVGDRIALPRHIPSSSLQLMSDSELALLGHLIGDGCTLPRHAIQSNLSRERMAKVAQVVRSEKVAKLASSDIYWDKVANIDYVGQTDVYDLTVEKHHNFVAENIIVHNSIEQDADIVINLYRDEYYNPDTPDRGVAEVIIAKHRNGPVGTVKLLFEPRYTWFENMASNSRG